MIKNQIVGLDLDYTLAYFKIPFWEIAMELCGHVNIYPPKHFGITDYPKNVQLICRNLFRCKWYMINLLNACLDSFLFILWLKSHNNTIHIISHRTFILREFTSGWIKGQFGNRISGIHYVDCQEDKIDYFDSLKLDLWVDDNPDLCVIAQEMGIKTYMKKQEWNNDLDCIKNNIVRVNTLSDIIDREESNGNL